MYLTKTIATYILYTITFIVFYAIPVNAQNTNYKTGVIIDSVQINNYTSENYQLYLPANYTSDTLWPIIYIFDPAARGSIGIQPFIKAAEKYGYILVCSNNSKNAPYEVNIQISNRLFTHVTNTLAIDSSRIYLAGFSGGSRLAYGLAVDTKNIAGVIGCGASIQNGNQYLPNKSHNFSYVGIIGDRDFNFQEMQVLQKQLNSKNRANHLVIYEGRHYWPSEENILIAMDWLELEAFRKNLKPVDTYIINKMYLKWIKSTEEISAKENPLKYFDAYIDIFRIFTPFINTDELLAKISAIKQSKGYIKQKKKVEFYEQKELELSDRYIKELYRHLYNPHDSLYKYWKREIQALQSMQKSKNSQKSKMAGRVLSKIWIWSYEPALQYIKDKEYPKMIFTNRIWIMVRPKDQYPYYHLARAYAATGKSRLAIKTLKKGYKTGLNNKQLLEETSEFKELKKYKKFNQLLSEMEVRE